MKIRNEWIHEWINTVLVSFLFFSSFKLMAFPSLLREQKHTLAKPDCQEDRFLFSGWVGLLEKSHFNWKMDSFTSWQGFLGQCSTTTQLPSTNWERATTMGKELHHLEDLGVSEDRQASVLIKLRYPSPKILLLEMYSSPRFKGGGGVLKHSVRAYLVTSNFTSSFMQVRVSHHHSPPGAQNGHNWYVTSLLKQKQCMRMSQCLFQWRVQSYLSTQEVSLSAVQLVWFFKGLWRR